MPFFNVHILALDDDKAIRELLTDFLHHQGYRVTALASGAAAINFLKLHSDVRLIIADVKMPEMTGTELLQLINDQDLQIPMILITAFGSADEAKLAKQRGAYAYITKPFHLAQLFSLISAALNTPKRAKHKN